MPMRQSDDYLTARAANPRTGLISPSVAGTPRTPESPGYALRVNKHDPQVLLTAQQETQDPFSRKLCGVGTKSAQATMWLRDGSSWLQDTRALKMSSPIISSPDTHADLLDASSHPGFSEDQFTVKMPSAREPQPYKFPGSSNAQIRAFEHYKHKAKRSSVEGYDQRFIDLYQESPVDSPIQHPRAVSAAHAATTARSNGAQIRRKPHVPAHVHVPQVTVPKQQSRVVHNDPSPFFDTTPPVISIQPATRNPSAESNVTTIWRPGETAAQPAPHDATEPRPECITAGQPQHVPRRTSNESTASSATIITSRAPIHLGQLPRVRLVHPSLAGTPTEQQAPTTRKCSLGCARDRDGSTCTGTKRDLTPILDPSLRSMLEDPAEVKAELGDAPSMVHFVELVALAFTILWQVLLSGIASHEQALHKLFPPDLTLWEKLMIVKSLLLLAVKATAIFLIIAVMWKVADVAMQLLRFLLMPLRLLTGFNR